MGRCEPNGHALIPTTHLAHSGSEHSPIDKGTGNSTFLPQVRWDVFRGFPTGGHCHFRRGTFRSGAFRSGAFLHNRFYVHVSEAQFVQRA